MCCRYSTAASVPAVKSIMAEIHYGLVPANSGKPGRHLRQLDRVWCSSDGRFALALCSDNSVLLYSLVADVFSSRQGPDSVHCIKGGTVDDAWKGHITTWFQANDLYFLHFELCYKPQDEKNNNIFEVERSPLDLMVSVAWQPSWKHADKLCKDPELLIIYVVYSYI